MIMMTTMMMIMRKKTIRGVIYKTTIKSKGGNDSLDIAGCCTK